MKKSNFLSARKVHSNGITITGHFNSQKLKGIQFESLREESFLKLAEMDVSVTNVLDQPKKIDLDGFSYTPDFYLELKDRRPAYVEIKTTEFIKKLFKQEHWKVKMIENWCNLRNTDFLIIPVDKISDEIISNTFFLSGYRNVPVDNLMRQLIIKKIRESYWFNCGL
jgi:predicted nuclease of restriction endonuclease-like RecB superfamily